MKALEVSSSSVPLGTRQLIFSLFLSIFLPQTTYSHCITISFSVSPKPAPYMCVLQSESKTLPLLNPVNLSPFHINQQPHFLRFSTPDHTLITSSHFPLKVHRVHCVTSPPVSPQLPSVEKTSSLVRVPFFTHTSSQLPLSAEPLKNTNCAALYVPQQKVQYTVATIATYEL